MIVCELTYASTRVLYSKTPEIKCAANLQGNITLVSAHDATTLYLVFDLVCGFVSLNNINAYVNHLVKEPPQINTILPNLSPSITLASSNLAWPLSPRGLSG